MSKTLKRRWIVVGAAGILVLVFCVSRSFRSLAVPSITLKAQDAVETVLATGRVAGEKTIPLAFVRPGRVGEELIADGDRVTAGQVLMRQENAREETALARKKTALSVSRLNLEKLKTVALRDQEQKVRQARANAAYAEDYLKRQTELFNEKTITALQFEQARRDRELADATLVAAENQLKALQGEERTLAELQVSQAENDLRQAEIDLRDTMLRAPFDGQVVEHLAHKGEFVQAGQRVVTFIPATPRTYVEVQVDELNLGKLRPGQKASVSSLAFPGKTFPAAVERVGSIVDTQRGTFTVRIMLDTLEPDLLPESSVSAQAVIGEARGVIILEQRFVVREGREAFVFAAEGGRAKRKAVVVRDLGNGLFGVDAGLKAGEAVLLPQGLKDGAKVKPVPLQG